MQLTEQQLMEVRSLAWELQNDRPIYAQLIEQIELMIVTGLFPAGSKLPSVRDLATDAAVNPNTMQRALAELEGNGLLYSQRTSGRFVTEDVERIMQIKNSLAAGVIREFVARMQGLGYDKEQTAQLLSSITEEEATWTK